MMHRRYSNISAFLVVLFVLGGTVPSLAARETRRVLVLWSQERGHPAHDLTEEGIRAAFLSNSSFDVELYNEYLDVARFPGPGQASLAAGYLRRKYSGIKIDAIIAVYPYAVDFLLAARSTLFSGVPIIACEASRSYAENLEHSPFRRLVTGTIVGDNVTDIIAVALRMRPDTKRVALVAGTSPNDIYGERVFRRGISAYAGKIETIDLTKLSMAETLSRVGSLPPGTIIFYESILRDGAGEIFVPREALSLISRAANVPVFGIYDSFMGFGIVGGRLVSFEQHGKEAAALAIRVMSGESPAAIPFGGEKAYVNLYDWRELKRWGVSEKAVPDGSVILYRQGSLWRDHWISITGALLLTMIEGLLIIGLAINLQRRRKVERSLVESRRDVQRLAVGLITTQEEELSRFSRELHDDISQRLAGLAIDAGILEKRLMPVKDQAWRELRNMKIKLIDVSEDIHDLSRRLHPSILDDMGLVEAVRSEVAVFSRRTGIALSFEPDDIPNAISKDIALCLYRVIQEGLRNIEKHSKAAKAHIFLQAFSDGVRLSVRDSGAGFDNKVVRNKTALGLSSMRERVGLVSGTISIKTAPGKGTQIEIFVPLGEENDQAERTDR
jgi:signal transduction histidine kinase